MPQARSGGMPGSSTTARYRKDRAVALSLVVLRHPARSPANLTTVWQDMPIARRARSRRRTQSFHTPRLRGGRTATCEPSLHGGAKVGVPGRRLLGGRPAVRVDRVVSQVDQVPAAAIAVRLFAIAAQWIVRAIPGSPR